jgi:20S proteasome subunit beta 3
VLLLCVVRFGPFFVEPVIAGLDDNNLPFVCATDLIGAPVYTSDFVVGGTCSEQLYGMCEALYRPDMVQNHCVAGYLQLFISFHV